MRLIRNENIWTEERLFFDGKEYQGVSVRFGNVPLLIVKTKMGFVASTYIDKDIAEKFGDIACFVTNVKSFKDLYKAKVKDTTTWASDLGIRPGMSIKKALEVMGGED